MKLREAMGLLGVPDLTITEPALRKIYLGLIFKNHPDRNQDRADEANSATQGICEAYDILKKAIKQLAEDSESTEGRTEYADYQDEYSPKIGGDGRPKEVHWWKPEEWKWRIDNDVVEPLEKVQLDLDDAIRILNEEDMAVLINGKLLSIDYDFVLNNIIQLKIEFNTEVDGDVTLHKIVKVWRGQDKIQIDCDVIMPDNYYEVAVHIGGKEVKVCLTYDTLVNIQIHSRLGMNLRMRRETR